jgi:hypothetical protein
MEYGYQFDNDSPQFQLRSLWFLLGVMVFAFTVLVMSAIVTAGKDGGYYLNVQQQTSQPAKPAATFGQKAAPSSSPATPARTAR